LISQLLELWEIHSHYLQDTLCIVFCCSSPDRLTPGIIKCYWETKRITLGTFALEPNSEIEAGQRLQYTQRSNKAGVWEPHR
jgi:hypothetical protein